MKENRNHERAGWKWARSRQGIGIIFFVLGAIAAGTAVYVWRSPAPAARGKLIREGRQLLINPLLGCEIADQKEFSELQPVKDALTKAITDAKANGLVRLVSVYVRMLNSGRWFDLNGDEKYSPASMLKIVTMLAYFHLAEIDSSILSQALVFNEPIDRTKDQTIKPPDTLRRGQSYTVGELIERMIRYSDNNADFILTKSIDPKNLKGVYADLNLPQPKSPDEADFMTAKDYAFIFRVLYGSTYLNNEYSQKALDLLTKTEFKDGIARPFASDLVVAHKFGERVLLRAPDTVVGRELHDCGIVYYPNHPYLLCVMTAGQSLSELQTAIQSISQSAYAGIEKIFNRK